MYCRVLIACNLTGTCRPIRGLECNQILHYISRKCLVRDTTEDTESMLLRFSYA